MREIKFRSWANGAMWHVNGLACTDESENMDLVDDSIGGYDSVYDYDEVETRVLMQYTGLKDMNGKEIYEGDIIRRDFEVGHEVIDPVSLGVMDYEISESGYFVGVVSYRPTEGYVLNKCRKYNEDGTLQAKKSGVKIYSQYANVIGNIFENPELLEEK